jgi:hypothetical protein
MDHILYTITNPPGRRAKPDRRVDLSPPRAISEVTCRLRLPNIVRQPSMRADHQATKYLRPEKTEKMYRVAELAKELSDLWLHAQTLWFNQYRKSSLLTG